MLDSSVLKSLSECIVKDSVIHIPGSVLAPEVLQEFKVVLRRLVLTGRVPHCRPIKVLIEGVSTNTVIEYPKGLSNSYLDMITILKNTVIADEHDGFDINLAGCNWPKSKMPRQFDASIELERRQAEKRKEVISEVSLFTSKSNEYGEIYVSDLRVLSADYTDGKSADDYLSVKLKTLLANPKPINKVVKGSNARIAIMWANILGDVSYEVIDRSTREINGGVSIEQTSSLSDLFVPMLSESEGNTIYLLSKKKMNEDVLQSILRSCGAWYLGFLESTKEDIAFAEESLYGRRRT